MIRLLLVPAALLLLQACALRDTRAAQAAAIRETTPKLHFLYSYPAQAAAIPELALLLRKEGLERLAEARHDAAQSSRPRGGPNKVEQEWEVTADTPDLIALTSTAHTYIDGSAHGYYGHRNVIWSRPGRRALKLAELFSDGGRGVDLVMADLCAKLNSARDERRSHRSGRQVPMECPQADDTVVVPVAGANGKITSFRMLLTGDETPDGYAGGGYEIEAPVAAALLPLVHPDLRASF